MKKCGIFILVAVMLIAMVASFGDFGGSMSGYATAAGPLDDNSLMRFRYGITSTPRELNHSDGVTSALQTQLDAIVAGTGTTLADTQMFIGQSTGISAPKAISGDSSVTNAGVWTNDKIDNKAVDFGDETDGHIQVATDAPGAGTGSWDSVAVSGDIGLANTGAMTIQAGAVEPSMLSTKSWQIMVAGSAASAGGDVTETVTNHNINNGNLMFASLATTDDTDFVNTVANSDHSVLTIVSSADPSTAHSYDYAGIINNPSIGDVPWQVIGAFNSASAGGDATETVAVAGSLTTDIVIVGMEDDGANDVTIAAARVSANGTVTITLSADPATAMHVSGIVVRPNSTDDAESHSIVYAGSTTTAGGAAEEAITVTGALTTDIVIALQSTFVDQILEFSHAVADAINVTFDGDPGTDEVVTWMVLRAN